MFLAPCVEAIVGAPKQVEHVRLEPLLRFIEVPEDGGATDTELRPQLLHQQRLFLGEQQQQNKVESFPGHSTMSSELTCFNSRRRADLASRVASISKPWCGLRVRVACLAVSQPSARVQMVAHHAPGQVQPTGRILKSSAHLPEAEVPGVLCCGC